MFCVVLCFQMFSYQCKQNEGCVYCVCILGVMCRELLIFPLDQSLMWNIFRTPLHVVRKQNMHGRLWQHLFTRGQQRAEGYIFRSRFLSLKITHRHGDGAAADRFRQLRVCFPSNNVQPSSDCWVKCSSSVSSWMRGDPTLQLTRQS